MRSEVLGLLLGCVLLTQAAGPKGCTSNGKSYIAGDQVNIPGECSINFCIDDGTWSKETCEVVVGAPEKWVMVPENLALPYPECCNRAVPPLNIVPDILDHIPWVDPLEITYEGDKKVTWSILDKAAVDLGNELTPTQVKSEPTVTYQADPDSYYLLCMTGPDAPVPDNPTLREFLHWLVVNIPGSEVSKGELIAEYFGVGPPMNSGLHRYVTLLYKQPGMLTFDEPRLGNTTAEGRGGFSIRMFAKKYNLGDPVAINVFQAQYDEYSLVLSEGLKPETDQGERSSGGIC